MSDEFRSSWRDQAACLGRNPEEFFIVGTTAIAEDQRDQARNVCWNHCPVRLQCLASSLSRDDRFGVFGGYEMSQLKSSERRRHLLKNALEALEMKGLLWGNSGSS
jgi:WhiB family redox-sensing transcriptional regulator